MEEFENSFFLQAIRDAQQPPPVELANGETLERLKNPPSCMMTDGEDDVEQLAPNLASIESDNDGSFSDGLFQLAERRIGELAKQNEVLSRENARLRESSTTDRAASRPSTGERDALERKIAQLLEENHGLLRAIEQLRGQRIEARSACCLGHQKTRHRHHRRGRRSLLACAPSLRSSTGGGRSSSRRSTRSSTSSRGRRLKCTKKTKAVAALKQETEEHRDALKRAQATLQRSTARLTSIWSGSARLHAKQRCSRAQLEAHCSTHNVQGNVRAGCLAGGCAQ